VDLVTHGLTSVAIARAFFPRAGKVALFCTILSGVSADADWVSAYGGASAFLGWHRTSFHSIAAAILMPIVVVVIVAFLAHRWGGILIPLGTLPAGENLPEHPAGRRIFVFRRFFAYILGAPFCAALLHIAMDSCQSEGVALFWPFSAKRIAADCLPCLDPWILMILVGAVALPELLHLVSSEIGAKAKKPRGQNGAVIGLALLVVYIGVRAMLHSNALAMMQSRTFHGETPRRTAAFPETLSLVTWHAIAETERALNQATVDVAGGGSFDPDTSMRIFKPEPSAELDAARGTEAAARFLAFARFPKATAEKTEKGYVVQLRDLRFAASGETQHEIAAIIRLDEAAKVTSEELIWARDLHR
jgi:membrane-bound metal-dependent hydrolase YbcI (DUF457 family)